MGKDSTISYSSPIYLQLREVVRTKIEEGEYLPGTAIPSENEFSEIYGINRLTVRNAIDALVAEGMLKRVQGKGVFVVGNKDEHTLDTIGGFTQTAIEKKAHQSTKIVSKTKRLAGDYFSHIFNISPDDVIYYVKQIYFADDEPISLKEMFIPMDIVPKLDGIDLTVFDIIEVYDFYGVNLTYANQILNLSKLDANDARLLNVDPESTVFSFICKSFDNNDRMIEFSQTYTRGDKCNFTVNFHK